MEAFVQWLTKVNSAVNEVVWGWPMIILILGTGIYLTVRTKVLQVRKFGTSWGETIIPVAKSLGKKQLSVSKKEKTISPFEAFATAISGTVGTGNIVGVTSAIMVGGPGAVFWMWISAFFGMVTNYAENVLGMYYRKKDSEGEFIGGPMQYLSEGMGRMGKGAVNSVLKVVGKILAVMACVFCLGAAIGMSGVQASKISDVATTQITGIDPIITSVIVGIIVATVLALIILGGIKSIGRVTAILVPFMSLIFIIMSIVIIFTNIAVVGAAFAAIFSNIVSLPAVAGGVGGFAIAEFTKVIQKGLARGVFSNEAGLGSSVIAHSASATREPVKQGLWGIFEVFFDTFIICTLTALVVLVSMPAETLYATNAVDTAVSMSAFSTFIPGVKAIGSTIYSIMMPLFAFTTILAWSYYGERCVQYLFTKTGVKGQKIATSVFKVLYVMLVIVFVVLNELQKSIPELPNELIWGISDTFNGLMALPNLIGLVFMGGLVAKITKNYFDRKKGKDVEPMLSAYPEQNAEFMADLAVEKTESEPVEETVEQPVVEEETAVTEEKTE